MVTEFVAKNITDLTNGFVEITNGFDSTKPWWRGHADVSWNLIPSLYRREHSETNMNVRFRQMAKVRYEKCPEPEDSSGWLFLMQHYRLPTRLLDWSESPLVALFFALDDSSNAEKDAAIWGMAPTKLNLQQGGYESILGADHTELRKLSRQAFVRNAREETDSRTLAVQMSQLDLRHMVQQSVATIHGSSVSINELPEPESFLARVRIPAASKASFRQLLSLYGISRSNLFPDLDNLAQELASLEFEEHA